VIKDELRDKIIDYIGDIKSNVNLLLLKKIFFFFSSVSDVLFSF